LQPGDQVQVEWQKGLMQGAKECYPKRGVVVQITPKFAAIRSPGGFVFCVGVSDLVSKTAAITAKKGAG
jgi:hypothetical protein